MPKLTGAYELDSILLRTGFSELQSRRDVDLHTEIGDVSLKVPILSAPMASITERDMAIAMAKEGGLGIVHRYNTIQQQVEMVISKYVRHERPKVAAAVNRDTKRVRQLIDWGDVDILVLDVAHGWSKDNLKFGNWIKYEYDIPLIAGNITESDAINHLYTAGFDGARVGIGQGSVCTTREVAGVGVPLASCLVRLNARREKEGIEDFSLIVDGGVRNSGDILKCLALGADAVITGKLLAGTEEASGNGGFYYGMASTYAMERRAENDPDFKLEESIHMSAPEGKTGFVMEGKGSVHEVMNQLKHGIQIGMSYVGAKNLKDLREKAQFVVVK